MSIRRIGGGSPFVHTQPRLEAERRIEAVEKYAGTAEAELDSAELDAQAELAALEAERVQLEEASRELRAKLHADGFEPSHRQLVDLQGGAERASGLGGAGDGVSLSRLARASVYAAAQAQEARGSAPVEESVSVGEGAVALEGVEGLASPEELAELAALEEAYVDPGADSFLASVEDIPAGVGEALPYSDPGADSFLASLEDIPSGVENGGAESGPEDGEPR